MKLSETGEARVRGYLFVLQRSLQSFMPDATVADALQMRLRTVKYHVSQVIQRTGANGRAGLVAVLLADAG